MPRVGFTDAETWNGIVAVLFGLVPSLVATVAVIGLGLTLWLILNASMLSGNPWCSGVIMLVLTLWMHFTMERQFWQRGGAEEAEKKANIWWILPILLSIVSAIFMGIICNALLPIPSHITILNDLKWDLDLYLLNPRWAVLLPAATWLLVAGGMIIVRLLLNRRAQGWNWSEAYTALALDRASARCLVGAVVWGVLGASWLLAVYLLNHKISSGLQGMGISGGAVAGLAGLFAWLRNWLMKPVEVTNAQTILQRLKPLLPQFLAYAAMGGLVILVCQVILWVAFDAPYTRFLILLCFGGVCATIVGLALWLFDPANVGLHEFYRSRIARGFLGAANPESLGKSAAQNRQTNERQKDDIRLTELRGTVPADSDSQKTAEDLIRHRQRPIHLICCAANNLAGDPLSSLYRGARSAVLSQRGVSLGNETASLPDLNLSSALTASAAAFNSNMGSISMHLGLPVAFLMTALNLRLGLWVPHPRNSKRTQRNLPGVFFFQEMFGITKADPLPYSHTNAQPHDEFTVSPRHPEDDQRFLHLSDGGHFENFGLYELIRRHCRYIIVSDCGADPQYDFDDLSNAIRKVREDFGVEIELELGPIRPAADGFARQHLVVGVIHYDGVTGCDKGTLIYFKPVLSGNEPGDVLQYKTGNGIFPQEPTSDQFYNEAQWEAYHRLGEHSGHEAFRFIESIPPNKIKLPETIFHFAREQWQPGWQEQKEQFLALTNRCAELEAIIQEQAPAFMRAEFFPEVVSGWLTSASATSSQDDQLRSVYFLMMVTQVMEDTWLACRLDTEWAHPLNEGWMAYLNRWASTPSFFQCTVLNHLNLQLI